MASQQLSLDVADLEIEALDLIPIDDAAGGHDVTEIGASCNGRCACNRMV